MNQIPDFSHPGYQVKKELGRNKSGDRASYLATHTHTQQPVIIKQLQFALFGSDWSGFTAYQREIQVLKRLSHPGIPRYLDSFLIPNGFCLVREAKNAQPLSTQRNFEPAQIKQIAISLLEILVYLQDRTPPVIHRNIKPENVLIDDQLNVYLVDFGFAYMGSGGAIKNAVAGTVGFMPIEQLRNKQLTEASDLYSIGATLLCLLTQTKSSEIESLNDAEGRINYYAIIPKEISRNFIEWLEKMIEVYPAQRYAIASVALEALNQIDIVRSPEIKLKPASLEFKATNYGEELIQYVTVSNDVPDTVLQGNWQVAPHPNEPRHSAVSHAWISFGPANFESNKIDCAIAVDTSKLMADTTYEREIYLQSNASPKTHSLIITVKTAPLISQKLPQRALEIVFAVALLGGAIGSGLVNYFFWLGDWGVIQLIIGLVLGGIAGLGGAFGCVSIYANTTWILFVAWFGGPYLTSVSGWIFASGLGLAFVVGYGTLVGYAIGFVIGAIAGYAIRYKFGKPLPDGANGLRSGLISLAGGITLLVATFGLSVGLLVKVGFNLWSILAVAATAIPLRIVSDRYQSEREKLIAKYRKSEPRLIKP